MNKETISKGKAIAITSYILFIGPLIALSINSENKNEFAAFHIRQAIGISITFIVIGVSISYFNNIMIASSMWIFISVLSMYGIFTAANGLTRPIPLLGNYFQKLFR
jgi:uncharacterized membrane protein